MFPTLIPTTFPTSSSFISPPLTEFSSSIVPETNRKCINCKETKDINQFRKLGQKRTSRTCTNCEENHKINIPVNTNILQGLAETSSQMNSTMNNLGNNLQEVSRYISTLNSSLTEEITYRRRKEAEDQRTLELLLQHTEVVSNMVQTMPSQINQLLLPVTTSLTELDNTIEANQQELLTLLNTISNKLTESLRQNQPDLLRDLTEEIHSLRDEVEGSTNSLMNERDNISKKLDSFTKQIESSFTITRSPNTFTPGTRSPNTLIGYNTIDKTKGVKYTQQVLDPSLFKSYDSTKLDKVIRNVGRQASYYKSGSQSQDKVTYGILIQNLTNLRTERDSRKVIQ